ncbi:formin-J-like isoform X4 [Halichondria panicea]
MDDEPMNTEQETAKDLTAHAAMLESCATDPETKEAVKPEELTFWKQVTDPKSNHTYYWNPRTNQVSWTLPDNGVIADNTPDNPVPEDTSMEPEADNPYADYYAYYKQFYGKTDTEASNTEEDDEIAESKTDDESAKSKTDIQSDLVNKTGPKPLSTKKDGDPATEIIIGPLLPPSHVPKDAQSHVTEEGDVTARPGLKRKACSEEDTEGLTNNSLDPVSKKQRLKSKAVGAAKKNLSPQIKLSPQAEQALRFQVSNMADQLTRKLGYLHVTNEGLSDVQLLSIQLHTRLSDWKEGGINSKFMLSKLRSFAVSLQEYEQSAAPEGWKVVWDSSSCRYQYHNLSTGETTWEYPTQLADSHEISGQEDSSDNEEFPLVTPAAQPTTLNVSLSNQLPTSDEPNVNLPPAMEPTRLSQLVTTAEVSSTPPGPPPIEPTPDRKGECTPKVQPTVRHSKPPSPSTKSELTLQKVRQKLYPGLRPQRSRESTDNIEIPLLAPTVITEVPPEAKNYAIVEQQVVPINPEGVEFISEYPPPSEEKIVSDSPKSSGVFDMGVIKSDESSAKAAAPSTQQITESEARIRERLLERHRIKFSVSSKDKKEEVPPISAVKQPMNKPQPEIPVNRVEQSTGEGVQGAVVIAPPPGNTQGSGVDDSRVEPETGEVEPLPGSKSDPPIAIEKTEAMLVKTSKGQGQKTSSGLYQNWSPSPTESIERFPSSDQKRVTKEGEESSESSADSGSTGKGETVGRCYMDSEEKRERITSERSRSPSRKSKYEQKHDDYHSDSDRGRYSDVEVSSRKHKSSRRSRRDYSSDDSEERSSRRERHHRSHHYDNSDDEHSKDEHSKRRSSRSSHRSSKKNRSRSRSGHRRKRSHSKDSHSPHSTERSQRRSPKHKKVKKEKRKKHHKTDKEKKDGKKDENKEEEASKPPPNVIVGKVGRISTQRTLGKDRKPDDKPETPKTLAAQQPQAMSATYYQHPTTGEVPYYYYQGYYDPSAYQQWGQGQGQWYGQDVTQATPGVVQYPSQYTTNSQYATTTAAIQPETTQPVVSTPMTGEPHTELAQESRENVGRPPTETESINVEADKVETDTDKTEHVVAPRMEVAEAETGEAVQMSQDLPQEAAVVQVPQIPIPVSLSETVEPSKVQRVAEDVLRTVDSSDKIAVTSNEVSEEVTSDEVGEEVSVYTYDAVENRSKQGTNTIEVEIEEPIMECDMDIDEENTPSPQPFSQEPSNEAGLVIARDNSIDTNISESIAPPAIAEHINSQEEISLAIPLPPTLLEDPLPQPPPEAPPTPPADSNSLSDKDSSLPKPFDGDAVVVKSSEALPAPPTPPTPPATSTLASTTTTTDYSAYMLANQQQQAYSYAYATNNYVQAAYNAYVQQASAAAYQAYGAGYPGYSAYPAASSYGSSYGAGYYGTTGTTTPTTPTSGGGGYGKMAYQLAQEAANTSTSDSSDAKKSEFAIPGTKSKQMKNMMDKWSSFKDKEDSSS